MPVGPLASTWILKGGICSWLSWLGAGNSLLIHTNLLISLHGPPEPSSLV